MEAFSLKPLSELHFSRLRAPLLSEVNLKLFLKKVLKTIQNTVWHASYSEDRTPSTEQTFFSSKLERYVPVNLWTLEDNGGCGVQGSHWVREEWLCCSPCINGIVCHLSRKSTVWGKPPLLEKGQCSITVHLHTRYGYFDTSLIIKRFLNIKKKTLKNKFCFTLLPCFKKNPDSTSLWLARLCSRESPGQVFGSRIHSK